MKRDGTTRNGELVLLWRGSVFYKIEALSTRPYIYVKRRNCVPTSEVFPCVRCIFVYGRVAVDVHHDDINLVAGVKPLTKNESIIKTHIDIENVDNAVQGNLIHVNISIAKKPCVTKTLLENIADNDSDDNNEFEPCAPEVKIDNGTALILTPLIKEGKVKEARKSARVDSKLFLGFKSYSGFLTVNETYNSNLFFWFFPVANKPLNSTPWIIWLQGGPGASSLTGLFDEIGPFTVINETLKRNPYSWLSNHSLLFIDNPVGTGYSFTEHEDGFAKDMATYSQHLYTALKQFLQMFPELRPAPLFLAGESYAGKYVPAMAMEIHKRKDKIGSDINLEGLIIGNAYVDPDMISHLAWPFYYFGLLEKEQIEIAKPLIDSFQQAINANNSSEAKNKWNSLVTVLLFLSHQKHAYNFLEDELVVGRYVNFLRTTPVKRAIHVGDIKFGWVNMTVNVKMAPDFLSTTKPMFERLLEHYKVLAYCGQLDLMLPCVFTSENYRTWKWNGSEEFLNATRFPYIFNSKLAG
ncbi:venom serine carboxypeptidase-like isoform X1 [Trichoplusia ni]|uniref:Carboxypeptidase n=1 Tax=Trichoplusia ni TaxID=7111 RepID=A0A7E5VEX6_TRINI|nr:venom serine carboxypeptidase-like isoform X1 [Trichoplusia ni]XP_026726821.1 venom serine carboxypeptidase-like isoform X1 [Trichoplusia ni]